MNQLDVVKQLIIRAKAQQNKNNNEYQLAVKGLTTYIKKLGRLITYDNQFKGMILAYLENEYNCWEGGTHHKTYFHNLNVKRADAIADLISFIVTEWRD